MSRIGLDSNPTPLYEILAQGLGFSSESFPSTSLTGASTAADGTVYFSAIPLRAGMLITNMHIRVTTVAATSSLAKMGLYDTAGNRLAVTADLGTAWESVGAKTHVLATPYSVATSGLYFAAAVSKGGTPATWARNNATANAMTNITGYPRVFGAQASQTDLPSTATIAAALLGFWMAVS